MTDNLEGNAVRFPKNMLVQTKSKNQYSVGTQNLENRVEWVLRLYPLTEGGRFSGCR